MQAMELKDADPEMYKLVQLESLRQFRGLELIASENFTSSAVMDCLGSSLTNKYSEGYPGKRYYGGNEFIDSVEVLCQKRALAAFHLDEKEWGVNVQPYSGSPANFAVYTALINPHDRIMGLDLPSGGHLTHGFYTAKRKVSATSIFFESFPYEVDGKTGLVDYVKLRANALVFNPKIIVCGGSAYPREWDYKELRSIADACGALLMTDMAHISGLVAAQVVDDPFAFSDIVTTTTHKTLRGPRAGMIFFRRDDRKFESKINQAVFPSLQGGPHNNAIAGVATQLLQVATPEFKAYATQVIANSRALAARLVSLGYTLATGGSDNHLLLMDLRPQKVSGQKVQLILDEVNVTLNKNSVYGDKSAMNPGGVRIGTPALTSRGLTEANFETVGDFIHRGVQIAIELNGEGLKNKAFATALRSPPEAIAAKIEQLRTEVEAFASGFFMPGSSLTPENYAAEKARINAL
jgi:glycine hydroxymethyltransferase